MAWGGRAPADVGSSQYIPQELQSSVGTSNPNSGTANVGSQQADSHDQNLVYARQGVSTFNVIYPSAAAAQANCYAPNWVQAAYDWSFQIVGYSCSQGTPNSNSEGYGGR